jgi:hypothetical protein
MQCQYLQKRNAEREEQFVLKNVVVCSRTVHLLYVVGLCISNVAWILTKKGKTELQDFFVSLFISPWYAIHIPVICLFVLKCWIFPLNLCKFKNIYIIRLFLQRQVESLMLSLAVIHYPWTQIYTHTHTHTHLIPCEGLPLIALWQFRFSPLLIS